MFQSIVIKEEPKDVEEINDSAESIELPEDCVEVVMNVKSEPGEQPMEEEYNDLPPSLTPEISMEIQENGVVSKLNSFKNILANIFKSLLINPNFRNVNTQLSFCFFFSSH